MSYEWGYRSVEAKRPKSLYDVLGISSTATPEEIKAAFRKLALELHPDRNIANPDEAQVKARTQRFIEVNDAYEVLGNAEKKRIYDIGIALDGPTPSSVDEAEEARRKKERNENIDDIFRQIRRERAAEAAVEELKQKWQYAATKYKLEKWPDPRKTGELPQLQREQFEAMFDTDEKKQQIRAYLQTLGFENETKFFLRIFNEGQQEKNRRKKK
jgi:curved DNA-binding protein CbpA